MLKYCHTYYPERSKTKTPDRRPSQDCNLRIIFSIHSLVSIAQEYLSHECCPLQHILTYKFSQDNIELLFNKICHRCGWSNNSNILQFMYVLRRLLIKNSIEPSNTGNCTHFNYTLYEPNGLFDFPSKWNQHQEPQLITMTMKRITVVKEC